MASLSQKPNGCFYLSFRYDGKQLFRSLECDTEKKANERKATVEKTMGALSDGILTLPEGCTPDDLWHFLRTGGKETHAPGLRPTVALPILIKDYFDSIPTDAKEDTSIRTERTHTSHFVRLLGKGFKLHDLDAGKVSGYIRSRQKEDGIKGRKVAAATINKELETMRQLWEFAKVRGYVEGTNPVSQVKKPKGDEKQPFMTYDEIEQRIKRGGLKPHEIDDLWDCLFLRELEVLQLLKHVAEYAKQHPEDAYIHPAMALCAFTGCRRSEMMRMLIDDVESRAMLREKKRSRTKKMTFRGVELHPKLEAILAVWIRKHPGGQHLVTTPDGKPISKKQAAGAFGRATKGSKWEVMRGYHVLRHSFASNLASKGVPDAIINGFMGHQTDEMRDRYRHLFPEDKKSAIRLLFA